MKRIALAALAGATLSIGAAQVASAADIPAPVYKAPPAAAVAFNWSGFYIGANAGYGWGRNCWGVIPGGDDGCFNSSGPVAGGQVGFNWQTGNLVLGVEGSGDWANIKGQGQSTLFVNDFNNTKMTALYTATARAGWAWDRTLLYVKGGAAWAREKQFGSCTGVPGCVPLNFVYASATETRLGWTVGAGVEYGITRNISAAVEYDYMNFGDRDVTLVITPGAGCAPCTWNIKQDLHLVTGRINYRFGS
jgi:outer membrane immunogenic protein